MRAGSIGHSRALKVRCRPTNASDADRRETKVNVKAAVRMSAAQNMSLKMNRLEETKGAQG